MSEKLFLREKFWSVNRVKKSRMKENVGVTNVNRKNVQE